jgi:hypothetical protein
LYEFNLLSRLLKSPPPPFSKGGEWGDFDRGQAQKAKLVKCGGIFQKANLIVLFLFLYPREPAFIRVSLGFLFLGEQAFLQDDLGHPLGSFAHDIGAMDIVGPGVMEFFKLLGVGKVIIPAQDFVLDVATDYRAIFLNEFFPKFSDELMGFKAHPPGIGKIIPLSPHQGA